jgi:hypothetical protein
MKNRLITNLLLAAIVISLGLVAWLKPGQVDDKQSRITSLDISSINLIRIERKNLEAIELKSIAKKWQIIKPINAPALPGKVERLLKISQIKPPVTYPLDASNLAPFGLEKPLTSIRFNNETLAVGKTESVHSRRYVSNNNQLFLVDDTFLHHLTAPLDAYIDTRLLPDGIEITSLQTPQINLQRDENNLWKNSLASSKVLSSDVVQMLLDEWRFARAIKVSYEPKKTSGKSIIITFNNGQSLSFKLQHKSGSIILISTKSNLAYTFSATKYKKMTTLAILNDNNA